MMDGLLMKYFVLKPKGGDVYAKASRMAMRRNCAHHANVRKNKFVKKKCR